MDIHDDDRPIGRILSRREVLKLLGVTGATVLVGGSYQALRALTGFFIQVFFSDF